MILAGSAGCVLVKAINNPTERTVDRAHKQPPAICYDGGEWHGSLSRWVSRTLPLLLDADQLPHLPFLKETT